MFPSAPSVSIATTRDTSATPGSGFNNTRSIQEKTVVVVPMPSASVRTATAVKPGDLASERSARRRSVIMGGEKQIEWRRRQLAGRRLADVQSFQFLQRVGGRLKFRVDLECGFVRDEGGSWIFFLFG